MRSDLHSLQNDSSSGSSSPHSNASHEEGGAMEMVDSSSNILHPKVVYNFSIPEFINHERNEERSRADSRPKRSRLQRIRQQQQQLGDSQPDNNDTGDRTIEIQDSPVLVQATKKRRRAAAALVEPNNIDVEEDDDDADCHRRRQHVPVIDLTGIDSHDEFNSPLGESERRTRGERYVKLFFFFFFFF